MRIGLLASIATLVALPAFAQEEPIQQTITAQIEAFKVDDFAKAFSYASPTIHQIFQNPANFGAMVTQGYPMVVRPAQVEMMDLRTVGGALWQRVRVTDQKGQSFLLDYQMIETPDGWQINAVQLQRAPDVGA